MAGKTNSAGKKSGQLRHPDGSPRLPGFFDDYGPSGVRLLDDAPKKPAAKKPGKKK